MRWRGRNRHKTDSEWLTWYALEKVEANKELLALNSIGKPVEGNALESWVYRYTRANSVVKGADFQIDMYTRAILMQESKDALDKELKKWKKSSTELNQSSTTKYPVLKINQLPRALNSFSFTGSLRRAIILSRASKMIRLITWGVCAEVLWYLPRFLELLLKHLGAGA